MSLVDFIEKLQKKPRYVRIQIMWVGAIVCAAIIFGFWLWSLTALLAQSGGQKEEKSASGLEEIKAEMPGLWQSLGAGISNVFQAAKEDLTGNSDSEIENQIIIEKLPIAE